MALGEEPATGAGLSAGTREPDQESGSDAAFNAFFREVRSNLRHARDRLRRDLEA
jgi:hypothetical protein